MVAISVAGLFLSPGHLLPASNMKQHYILYFIIALLALPLKVVAQAKPAQANEQSAFFHDVYRERTKVIKNDTVTYKARWFIPDQYNVQYAGGIGFMSVGFGYQIFPRYSPALYYGYLSESVGGSINTVHTISLKNTFLLTRQPLWGILNPTAGISVNWGHTNNTFDNLPDYYPEEYYFQNQIHFAPFVGAELKFKLNQSAFEAWGVYAEVSALDAYLLECIRTSYVKPHMILSVAVGVTFYLR